MDVTTHTSETTARGLPAVAVTPGADGYEDARRLWNGAIDKRPAVIVRCRGAADVIEGVHYARERGLPVSVRGGGHHVAGGALIDGGLVLDLSQMRSVRVDPVARTVRAEGGAQIGDIDREARPFGLVTPMGVFSETGIAGLTLAGGVGWLRRKYGLACDSLLSADVVIADGRLLHASGAENADLFWALKGGGWDMGCVTSLEYRAYPIEPELFFLFIAYPMDDARAVLRALRDFGRTAPDEASPLAVLWTFPEAEVYPPEIWNRQFVAVAGPYAGPPDAGERVFAPLRKLAAPLLDMSGRMPYYEVQKLFDEEYPNGRRYYWKSSYLRELSDAAIDVLVEFGRARPSPLSSVDVWLQGGAIAKTTPADSPAGHRDAPYLIGIEANWDEAADDAINVAWTRALASALGPFSTGGSYLNFEDLTDPGAAAAYHGESFERLVEIKRTYDPGNLFRSRRGLV
jgi:FAD/FMN-containing dehydrogenase